MQHAILVHAVWDPEASVFVAESNDVPGLVTEAATIEALREKLPGMIEELLDTPSGEIEIRLRIPAASGSKG